MERILRSLPHAALFIDECRADLRVMEVPLCTDRAGVDRRAVHAQLAREIEAFLRR